MKKILVVIDCQNDFIDGSLRNEEAIKTVPNIVKKIESFKGDNILVTRDTHDENYLTTKEGEKLPFVHCVNGTSGWYLNADIAKALHQKELREECLVGYLNKPTFGSFKLAEFIGSIKDDLEIEFVGFCTDICVISNVLMVKAATYENAEIFVDASCCAGVSVERHNAALLAMKSCQINITNWDDDPEKK